MNGVPALRILMVVEAVADARTVATLIDKVLLESEGRPSWIDDGMLSSVRRWVDLDSGEPDAPWPHVTWIQMKDRGPRVLGHGTGGPTRDPYARAARRAIQAANWASSRPNSVVLVVDADAQPERRAGLEIGREAQPSALRVVVGAADPKREAWVLNAFVPKGPEERQRLQELRRELKLNPCLDAHRLRGKHREARDIKRVLAVLVDNDKERELGVHRNTPLAVLATNGERTGLSAFLTDAASLVGALTDESFCASVMDE